jgi:hypothetical protein
MYYAVSACLPKVFINVMGQFESFHLSMIRANSRTNVELLYQRLLQAHSLLNRVEVISGDKFNTTLVSNTIFLQVMENLSEVDPEAARYLFTREIYKVKKLLSNSGKSTPYRIAQAITQSLLSVGAYSLARYFVSPKKALGISAGVSMLEMCIHFSSRRETNEQHTEQCTVNTSSRNVLTGGLRWNIALMSARQILIQNDPSLKRLYKEDGESTSDEYPLQKRIKLIVNKLASNPYKITEPDVAIIKQLIKKILLQHNWDITDECLLAIDLTDLTQ